MSLCFQTSFRIPCNKKPESAKTSRRSEWKERSRKKGNRRQREERRTNHIVPSRHDRLHVQIGREESDDTIGNAFAVLDEDGTEVSNDGRVVSDLETRGDVDLIGSSGDDLVES